MSRDHGTHRLRTGRTSVPGQIYHVTTVSRQRRPVFADLSSARAVIRVMQETASSTSSLSLCFVLMPDHLHWLLQLGEHANLPAVMRTLKCVSARRIGAPIWQSGYHDRAIRDEDDVQAVARYIVANPLRAGLVERVGDYPHWDAIWLD